MEAAGIVIIVLLIESVLATAVAGLIAHALTRRYWLACAAVTLLVLLGCVRFHVSEGYRDALSIVMLYGIGGACGLALAALSGLPVLLFRHLRGPSTGPHHAERWTSPGLRH